MLTIRDSTALTRRNFLTAGTLGLAGLTLPDLLRSRASNPQPRRAATAC